MTAYIASCQPGRVDLLTDAAQYRADSTLLGTACKVFTVPGFPVAVVTRGAVEMGERMCGIVADLIAETRSLDDAITRLAVELPRQRADMGRSAIEVMIAGISEKRGPQINWFSTAPNADGSASFVMHTTRRGLCCGVEFTREQQGMLLSAGGPRSRGVAMMEALRAQKTTSPANPGGEPAYFVGGAIDFTVVDAVGVSTERVHTWPDRVGERINSRATLIANTR